MTVAATAAPRRTPTTRKEGAFGQAFLIAVAVALVWGWVNRASLPITAESGLGYALGIVGVACMTLLLIYPLRKRMASATWLGSVPLWFRVHMTLGLLGPAAILFHSGFSLGSLNSNVALFSMLTVAGSGLIGRFLYAKVHRGLFGKMASVRGLMTDAAQIRRVLSVTIGADDDVIERLRRLERVGATEPRGLFDSAWRALVTPWTVRRVRRSALDDLDDALARLARAGRLRRGERNRRRRDGRRQIRQLCAAVTQACELAFYSRLLALWHVLHLPLFFVMILAAIVHVVSVHLY